MSNQDPQWGRNAGNKAPESTNDAAGERQNVQQPQEQPGQDVTRDDDRRDATQQQQESQGRTTNGQRPRQQGNDLDELWDEFNRTLGSIFGNNKKGGANTRRPGNDDDHQSWQRRPSRGPRMSRPQVNQAGTKGLMGLFGAFIIGWCATGIYIVPEGQVGVVTTFGRYAADSAPGINWHMPWPVQKVEIVDVSSVRTTEIGVHGGSNRLREALMLTDDENIVDLKFNVQYRIKPHAAKDFLFRSRDPEQSVAGAAESAMREVVGRKTMDSVLFESKQEIATSVQKIMQQMLDRYQTGIEVMSVAIQNAQPPQQVQAAFNDAVKAGQDRERQINEGQAYANAVVPAAMGLASRLTQEAEGYKERVIQTASGDAQRFAQIYEEYKKAPKVTRDRLYIDTMRDLYANTKKVMVDTQSGNNLLYLPFDKLMEQSAKAASSTTPLANESAVTTTVPNVSALTNTTTSTVRAQDARTLRDLRNR